IVAADSFCRTQRIRVGIRVMRNLHRAEEVNAKQQQAMLSIVPKNLLEAFNDPGAVMKTCRRWRRK
ncbi:MAG: hypothetical protein ACJ8FY_18740, partial [Gemmataceae bacterium]